MKAITLDTLCDCCGELPVDPRCVQRGYQQSLCSMCIETRFCSSCERESLFNPILVWEEGICDDCQREHELGVEVEALETAMRTLADELGWFVVLESVAQTGTCYYSLTDTKSDASLVVRVGDHATAYCSEDISLVPLSKATPDDHVIEDLRDMMERRRVQAKEDYDDV